jgi:hypothetical protein
MPQELRKIKMGLALVFLSLVFGIGMGVSFGVNEDSYKNRIAEQVQAHPDVHDDSSQSKIWRYAQRAHFHATGIAAFSLSLILLVMVSALKARLKTFSSFLIGLGGLYPLAWFNMYWLAPSIGRSAAHHHILTESLTYIGVGGLLLGMLILAANLFFGFFGEDAAT